MSTLTLSGSPVKSLVPPGQCQFNAEFQAVPLIERVFVSETSSVLRFGLPDSDKPLNLSTCACILAKADLPTDPSTCAEDKKDATEVVVRPYTPISTNAQTGSFDLLVKHYPNGLMSKHVKTMPVGATLEFKHIDFNVKLQAPFKQKNIGMIVGGTGITPMIQALHAILGDETNDIKVSMLYGSKISGDILGEEMLTKWTANYGDSFSVTHVLSDESESSEWKGERGYITEPLIREKLPSPVLGDDAIIFVCGPPPMYEALCGPRGESEIKGVLADMGYKKNQVYKF
eukprot:CAMPEP_0113566300 /NCGR_PEP_ID=MMETSP0015_2-20120614/22648_1 /TAXON_ID=2838 /ORGANISM="Odontella" /LENGTH=286 /DNA_ID=CAMNT_0000468577 /DNA_START=86 /DNA_END=946 /DNA_ORIENTATION=+ /assembly_acc=CAM_ASM_000160